jgi:hypothetical protein
VLSFPERTDRLTIELLNYKLRSLKLQTDFDAVYLIDRMIQEDGLHEYTMHSVSVETL